MSQQILNPSPAFVHNGNAATAKTGQPNQSAVVAIYDTHAKADSAIRDLQKLGFDMTKLSIVAKDCQTEEHAVGYYSTGTRMKAWGETGVFWDGMWGLMCGSAFFVIPGIGPLLAAGQVVLRIVDALESVVVVGECSALGTALVSISIPEDSIIEYEKQIKTGKIMVIAHGEMDA